MKPFLLLSIVLFSVQSIFSQEDKIEKKKSIKINATTNPVTKPGTLNFNVTDGFKNAYLNSQLNKTPEQIEAELKNKGIISQAQLNEERWSKNFKTINGQYKKVDQHLGNFRSDSKYIRIICRDYQYPDGDRVTIYFNGIPVVYNIILTQSYQEFKIPLEKGINNIGFKALNQGTSGPNTAGFKVYDDADNLISENEWNLATGAIATLLIVKEK
jgi:hypothetical protein